MAIGQRDEWIGRLCRRPLAFVPIEQTVGLLRNLITVRRGLTAFAFWMVWLATAEEAGLHCCEDVPKQPLHIAAIFCFALAGASSLAQTRRTIVADGPDPREIPVPRIAAPLQNLPAVGELPTRAAVTGSFAQREVCR